MVAPSTERVDWEAVEHSEPFQQLVRKRRSFVLPATAFFLTWYLAFILLAGYAEDFMGERVYQGLTVGYVLALTQFLMVWGLGLLYLRRADRDFEPLERAAAEHAMTLPEVGGRVDPAAGTADTAQGVRR